jgi:hypothetical protein
VNFLWSRTGVDARAYVGYSSVRVFMGSTHRREE